MRYSWSCPINVIYAGLSRNIPSLIPSSFSGRNTWVEQRRKLTSPKQQQQQQQNKTTWVGITTLWLDNDYGHFELGDQGENDALMLPFHGLCYLDHPQLFCDMTWFPTQPFELQDILKKKQTEANVLMTPGEHSLLMQLPNSSTVQAGGWIHDRSHGKRLCNVV